MDELKKLISEGLEKACKEDQIVKILQQIGAKLINEYIIKIKDITIEPLWVEAYYYNKNYFPDCNTHLNDLQKERFGQIYIHRKGHGGFDICLSTSKDYYLSFLLKATLINGKFYTQTGIRSLLTEKEWEKSEVENAKNILFKRESILNYDVRFANRVGITKSCYRDEALAAFPMDVLNNGCFDFRFARKSLTPLAVDTIKDYKEATGQTQKECIKKCQDLFGWVPDDVRRIFEKEK